MRRRRACSRPGPGGAAGPGPALALLGTLLALATAGCDGSGGQGSGPGGPVPGARTSAAAPAATAATAPAVSGAELCTEVVTYWAREVLGRGTYGDYQSMGLSNGQYAVLRDVVDAARKARTRQDAATADRLIGHRARAGCAARYRDGTPGGGPWR